MHSRRLRDYLCATDSGTDSVTCSCKHELWHIHRIAVQKSRPVRQNLFAVSFCACLRNTAPSRERPESNICASNALTAVHFTAAKAISKSWRRRIHAKQQEPQRGDSAPLSFARFTAEQRRGRFALACKVRPQVQLFYNNCILSHILLANLRISTNRTDSSAIGDGDLPDIRVL